MKTILLTVGLLLLLCITPSFSQSKLHLADFNSIEVEKYIETKSTNVLHLKMDFGKALFIDEQQIPKDQKIQRVSYYYSDYPKNNDFTNLHNQRINALAGLLSEGIHGKSDIDWQIIRQTDCQSEAEARLLFHGFVVYLDDGSTEAGQVYFSEETKEKLRAIKTQVALELPKSSDDISQFLQGTGAKITNLATNDTIENARSSMYFTEKEGILGLFRGLILTTGLAQNAIGPNNSTRKTAKVSEIQCLDRDLMGLFTDQRKLFDACIIEFDVQIDADTLVFNYIFASEEYPEYIDYHDVFGFFITGKGIGGADKISLTDEGYQGLLAENPELPAGVVKAITNLKQRPFVYKNGFYKFLESSIGKEGAQKFYPIIAKFTVDSKNLAVVPGTSQPVSVETINHLANPHLYRPNDETGDLRVFKAWQYDGFSTVLQAKVKIIPNEVYHLKLAIADQGDARYDSAVFIEGKGIKSK